MRIVLESRLKRNYPEVFQAAESTFDTPRAFETYLSCIDDAVREIEEWPADEGLGSSDMAGIVYYMAYSIIVCLKLPFERDLSDYSRYAFKLKKS